MQAALRLRFRPCLLPTFLLILCASVRADDWPQWLGPNRDGVWHETGIVQKFPEGGPKIRWRVPIGGGYSGPIVVGDRVYVTDRILEKNARNPDNPFARGSIPGSERIVCLNDADGSVRWVHEYPCAYTMSYAAGPRATPVVRDGRLYSIGGEGDVRCINTDNGELIWKAKLGDPAGGSTPMWGYAGSPLLDSDRLICMADGKTAVVVALDAKTGQQRWQALNAKEPGYSSPIICQAGGTRQLIVWHPEALVSLDPETGKTFWSQPFTSKAGMSVATPLVSGDRLLISAFYDGSLMMRLDPSRPTATELWRLKGKNEQHTTTLHALMCTPILRDSYLYGVSSYGELRCVRADNGQRVWETYQATSGDEGPVRWSNAFIVPNDNHYFLFNEKGDLILADLSPQGYHEISRAHLLEPTNKDAQRLVVWSHPAFANRCVYVRNDKEIVSASLAPGP